MWRVLQSFKKKPHGRMSSSGFSFIWNRLLSLQTQRLLCVLPPLSLPLRRSPSLFVGQNRMSKVGLEKCARVHTKGYAKIPFRKPPPRDAGWKKKQRPAEKATCVTRSYVLDQGAADDGLVKVRLGDYIRTAQAIQAQAEERSRTEKAQHAKYETAGRKEHVSRHLEGTRGKKKSLIDYLERPFAEGEVETMQPVPIEYGDMYNQRRLGILVDLHPGLYQPVASVMQPGGRHPPKWIPLFSISYQFPLHQSTHLKSTESSQTHRSRFQTFRVPEIRREAASILQEAASMQEMLPETSELPSALRHLPLADLWLLQVQLMKSATGQNQRWNDLAAAQEKMPGTGSHIGPYQVAQYWRAQGRVVEGESDAALLYAAHCALEKSWPLFARTGGGRLFSIMSPESEVLRQVAEETQALQRVYENASLIPPLLRSFYGQLVLAHEERGMAVRAGETPPDFPSPPAFESKEEAHAILPFLRFMLRNPFVFAPPSEEIRFFSRTLHMPAVRYQGQMRNPLEKWLQMAMSLVDSSALEASTPSGPEMVGSEDQATQPSASAYMIPHQLQDELLLPSIMWPVERRLLYQTYEQEQREETDLVPQDLHIQEALQQAPPTTTQGKGTHQKKRKEAVAFAIDDEGTTEVDDAISLDEEGMIHIHVADVSRVIRPDSRWDLMARLRGETMYLPETKLKMLPDSLARALSLRPENECNHALTFSARLHEDGQLSEHRIERRVLSGSSIVALNYEQVDEALASESNPEGISEKQVDMLQSLHQLSALRKAYRLRQGAQLVQLPFRDVRLSYPTGSTTTLPGIELVKPKMGPAQQLVEESMLLANEIAAVFCKENEIPVLFRHQPLSLSRGAPENAAQVSEEILDLLRVRDFERAQLSPASDFHHGVGLQYTWATSPLRRYSDLLLHYQVRAFLDQKEPPIHPTMLPHIASQLNAIRIAQKELSLYCNRYWTYRLMNDDFCKANGHMTLSSRVLDIPTPPPDQMIHFTRPLARYWLDDYGLQILGPLKSGTEIGESVPLKIQHLQGSRLQVEPLS